MNKLYLKDLCSFQEGYVNPTQGNKSFFDGNVKWLRASDLNDGIVYHTERTLTEVGFKSAGKSAFLFKKDTIAISKSGTIGRLGILKDEMCGNRAVINIDVNHKLSNLYYIFYTLKYKKDEIINKAGGSIQKNLYVSALETISLNHSDLKKQTQIAKVLSDLDAKIELNNKINAELEAMAKTLFEYWFVQFDFPSPLTPKGGMQPYKSSGGKMVWNAELKRDIPEGWEVDTLSSFINNDKSGDWGKEQEEGNYNQKVYCVRGADINGLNGKGELKTPERYILEKNLFKTLDPHDLIVEISGGSPVQSTGRLAYITEETLHRFDAPIICSNFCKAVTLKNKYYFFNFVLQWNSIYDAGVLFGYEGKTSGIKNLLFESFVSSHHTAIPPIELAEKFYDFMKPIQIKKEKNLKENQELASLRDWLLPMLMNGQVSVGGYEVEERELGMVAEGGVEYKK